jgi:hypothetical protein
MMTERSMFVIIKAWWNSGKMSMCHIYVSEDIEVKFHLISIEMTCAQREIIQSILML